MQQAMIYVDVCGAVANPGVFQLAAGSRVFQAIEAAGGYLPEAALTCVNRAGVLTDGQQLYILTQEEMERQGLDPAEMSGASDGQMNGSAGTGQNTGMNAQVQQDNRININTADEAQLTTLTGIGATRAQAIIAYREENGKLNLFFRSTHVSTPPEPVLCNCLPLCFFHHKQIYLHLQMLFLQDFPFSESSAQKS